jgi:hypothetical protein
MRLGRRYPFQPQLQGPVVINPTPLPLEDQRTVNVVRPDRRRERDPRLTSSFLRPPILDAAASLTADQQRVRVVLSAETPAQQRPLASKLSPPIFEQAAAPVETVVRVVRAVRARFDRRKAMQPVLGAPLVVDPTPLPLEDQRTVNVVIPKSDQRQQRRKLSSRLFPAAADQGSSPVVIGLLKVFAPRVLQRALASRLFPPAVVDQPPVVTKLLTSLSESRRFRQLGTKVRPPATLAAPQPPVETNIRIVRAVRARFDRRKAMQPVLRGPIVVDPAAAANPPVETELRVVFPVRTQRQRYATKYELQPPAVVSQAGAPVVVGILTTLAAIQTRTQHRKRTPSKSRLSPPAVVSAAPQPPVVTELRVVFPVRLQPDRYGTKYRLLPPAVVGPVAQPPVVLDILKTLVAVQARVEYQKRMPGSTLSAPAIIDPEPPPPVPIHPDPYGVFRDRRDRRGRWAEPRNGAGLWDKHDRLSGRRG